MAANTSHERNLLFAGLGLQLSLLTKEQMVCAFSEWILNKNLSLSEILLAQKAITPEEKKAIEGAVDLQIQNDGGEVQALGSVKNSHEIETCIKNIEDQELQMTLTVMHCLQSRKILGNEEEAEKTAIPLGLEQPLPVKEPLEQRFQRSRFLDAGNLGEIWFAKDEELNRTVVLKYIKAEQQGNSFTKALFNLEGEVTGYLEHPAVVPVYGMGQDDQKRSFYAMRYIQGRKLTRAIADYHAIPASSIGKRREALTELLQAFQTACLAIEYAHSKGVLHCDLKPDNIVVGPFGETLVIDWGLAMVTNPTSEMVEEIKNLDPIPNGTSSAEMSGPYSPSQSAHPGLHASQGGMRKFVGGTPAYMAPEQMRATRGGEVMEVTHSSDIFGLGAILYHLLTSQAPYFPNKEKREVYAEFIQRIERGVFPQPRQLNPRIPKPLEAIVLKAMTARPHDRYASARELAEEVKRWLADEPIYAYKENAWEKSRRWGRNHRAAVVAGVVLILCLGIGGMGIALLTQGFNKQLRLSEKLAKEQESLAKDNEKKALIQERLAKENGQKALTQESLAKEQRDFAQKREAMAINAVKQFADAVEKSPDLKNRPELESLRKEFLKEPIHFFKELSAQLKSEKNPSPKSLDDLARGLFSLARLTAEIGNQEDAILSYKEEVTIREKLVQANPMNSGYQIKLASSHCNLAVLFSATNRQKEAEASYLKALAIQEPLVKANPIKSEYQNDLARSYNNLAILFSATNRQKEAEASYQKALAIQEPLVNANPTNFEFQADLANSHANLANLYSATNRQKEAEASYQKAIAIRESLVKANPKNSEFQNDLASSHNNLAVLFDNTNRQKEAEVSYKKSIDIQEVLAMANPTDSGYQNALARSHNNLANLFSDTNRQKEAELGYQKAIAIFEPLVKANPTNSGFIAGLARTKNNLAELRNTQAWGLVSLPGKVEEDYQKGLLLAQEGLKLNPQNGLVLNTLGVAQYRVKQFAPALETLQKSNAFNSKTSGIEDPSDLAFLAMTCHRLNKKEEAETYFKKLQEAMKEKKNSENKEYQGFLKEAETMLKK